MKVWKIKEFEVVEIEADEPDKRYVFFNKEEAFNDAINSLNERLTDNLKYLKRVYADFKGQKDVVKYYLEKREKLIREGDGIGYSTIDTNIKYEELEEIDKEIAVALLNSLNESQLTDTEAKEARKLLRKFKWRHPGKIIIK